MNYGSVIFLGAFVTFLGAWLGLIFVPNQQLKDLQPQVVEGTTDVNPRPYTSLELAGREVYAVEGCVYCHTQQARGGKYQADIQRGWGVGPTKERRSHPQDYIHDYPLLLGTMRTGPDLANIGSRQPSDAWHHLHLYNPQKVSPGSTMAPFAYLYETRKIVGQPSPEALVFDDQWTAVDGRPAKGYEVVPTDRAKALVAYLKGLKREYDIQPVAGGKP